MGLSFVFVPKLIYLLVCFSGGVIAGGGVCVCVCVCVCVEEDSGMGMECETEGNVLTGENLVFVCLFIEKVYMNGSISKTNVRKA